MNKKITREQAGAIVDDCMDALRFHGKGLFGTLWLQNFEEVLRHRLAFDSIYGLVDEPECTVVAAIRHNEECRLASQLLIRRNRVWTSRSVANHTVVYPTYQPVN